MGILSSIFEKCREVASNALEKAKDIAGQALGWMATKAEKFVGNIKSVWKTAKPFVSMVRKGLDMAAEYILLTPFPWIGGALKLISLGLGALTAFEKSPIAKAVDKAIQWSIKLAQKWHTPSTGIQEKERPTENAIAEDEVDTARQHQETFRAAAQEPTLSDDERRLLEVASVINDFELAKADVERAMNATPVDFEHYLRIRATNKLLKLSEAKFKSAKDICDLTSDDLFLVQIASDLVKGTPELSENSSDRLNNILEEQYKKKLLPFVFEELIASWAVRANELETKKWPSANQNHVRNSMLLTRLKIAKDLQHELSPEEAEELNRLEIDVPKLEIELNEIATSQHDIERYTGAAEGLLQLLEKTEDEIRSEGHAYLIDEGAQVGHILMDFANNNTPFANLSEDQKELIVDYSNIFQVAAKERMKQVLEITA
jgi:hypothetical protein